MRFSHGRWNALFVAMLHGLQEDEIKLRVPLVAEITVFAAEQETTAHLCAPNCSSMPIVAKMRATLQGPETGVLRAFTDTSVTAHFRAIAQRAKSSLKRANSPADGPWALR
jgi:hypothetical protein